jgi:hypothetical protein
VTPKLARLAALGAIGVAFGVIALAAFMMFGSRVTPTGGIDGTHAIVTVIGIAVPAAAVVAAHVVYAKILFDWSKQGS